MSLGKDAPDALAYDLVQSDFDAVERDGYRAVWTADNTTVVVSDLDTGDARRYDAEGLLRAASDREVASAREKTKERR